jgi:hypothetical protein
LRTILNKAWVIARAGARRFGGTARSYLAAAMRSVWAEQKAARAEIEAMRARVLGVVANLAAERLEMERLTREWCSRLSREAREREQERQRRRPATVLAFPSRPPVAVPAAPARRAA